MRRILLIIVIVYFNEHIQVYGNTQQLEITA